MKLNMLKPRNGFPKNPKENDAFEYIERNVIYVWLNNMWYPFCFSKEDDLKCVFKEEDLKGETFAAKMEDAMINTPTVLSGNVTIEIQPK